MALYSVQTNTASNAQDLDQLVQLLNGTDTSTQVTVANRVAAQMAGAAAASAYAGGVTAPTAPPGGTGWAVGDVLVGADGLLWVYTSSGWTSAGCGGYTARVHQRWNNQSLNRQRPTLILPDTVDYDPHGMWQPKRFGMLVPRTGRYRIRGRVGMTGPNPGVYARAAPLIYINGAETLRGDDGLIPSDDGGLTAEGSIALTAGELVQLWVWMSYGGAATTEAHLSMTYEGA